VSSDPAKLSGEEREQMLRDIAALGDDFDDLVREARESLGGKTPEECHAEILRDALARRRAVYGSHPAIRNRDECQG
jgi:hypothetical protein